MKIFPKHKNIDYWRRAHLSIAEWIDAWRIMPRFVVIIFGYGCIEVVKWYMALAPYMLQTCVEAGGSASECLIIAPSTQDTALLSALFALAAAVFGFYTNSSRKWNGFSKWLTPEDEYQSRDVDNKQHAESDTL